MARLIDADAYADEMRKKQNNCRAWKDSLEEGTELYALAEQSFVTFVEAALTLKSQPTIDAIPVEWLKEQRKKNDPESVRDINGAFVTICIDGVLALWQKEQEAQDG